MPLSIVYSTSESRLATLELDAVVSKSHGAEVDVTEHEVEEGANVTDHAKPKPETLRVEGLISDGPLQTGVQGAAFQVRPGRTLDALATLRRLKDEGALVTVTHNGRSYERLVIASLDEPEDVRSADAARVSIAFKRVRLVQTRSVAVRQLRTAIKKAQPEKKGGTQVPKPASAPVREVSAWKRLSGGAQTSSAKGTGSNIFGNLTKVPGIAGGS